ncbi:hypothetical protein D3C75_640220 [compost metagenome]
MGQHKMQDAAFHQRVDVFCFAVQPVADLLQTLREPNGCGRLVDDISVIISDGDIVGSAEFSRLVLRLVDPSHSDGMDTADQTRGQGLIQQIRDRRHQSGVTGNHVFIFGTRCATRSQHLPRHQRGGAGSFQLGAGDRLLEFELHQRRPCPAQAMDQVVEREASGVLVHPLAGRGNRRRNDESSLFPRLIAVVEALHGCIPRAAGQRPGQGEVLPARDPMSEFIKRQIAAFIVGNARIRQVCGNIIPRQGRQRYQSRGTLNRHTQTISK